MKVSTLPAIRWGIIIGTIFGVVASMFCYACDLLFGGVS